MGKAAIMGAGSWGIALAILLRQNGHDVSVWSALPEEIEELAEKREHASKLPGVKIPEDIKFFADPEEAQKSREMIVLAVPSPYTRSTARMLSPYIGKEQIIVAVSKGIEEESLMTQIEIVNDEIPQAKAAALSGPSHAEEVGRGLPTTVVAGAEEREIAERVQAYFMNKVFRVYTSSDVLGIELGGSLKNVIALAAGMADGLGFGDNAKAALITRGIAEIRRLALAMGARSDTLNGLSGIGDLIVTCASRHSRNRRAGVLIGEGLSVEDAMGEVQMVVEGVYSAKAAAALAGKYNVEMPIIDQVNQVLFCGRSARDAVMELMGRDKKDESDKEGW